ncbi:hypothetical protein [Glycomyces sp. NRRL B-16210]|uniref:hypothetical protein n=1 Tax=Glycomyces sp. NRRL B-16210 TaxID=1463821 RepID=UPI0004C2AE4A|nr:hypothetical protein [Glycomyces sp. NRRL B-16210]
MSKRRTYDLGEGVLSWPVGEVPFLSENCVALLGEGNQLVQMTDPPIGTILRLTAIIRTIRGPVLEADHERGVAPSIPFLGEQIVLGYGVLFIGDPHGLGATAVGVLPVENVLRADDWLDRFALYRAHNHIVRLRAETGRTPHIVRQRTPVSDS